jgi:hypothetical protein
MAADDPPTRIDFIQFCVESMRNAMQGRGQEFDEIHEDMPQNLFPCGALFPADERQLIAELEEEFGRTEYTPSALGLLVESSAEGDLDIGLALSLSLYYPVTPTHADVVRFVQRFSQGTEVKLPPKYRRIPLQLSLPSVRLRLAPTDGFVDLGAASEAFQRELDEARNQATSDHELYRIAPREQRVGHAKVFRVAELMDQAAWQLRVEQCTRAAEPAWSGRVKYRVRRSTSGWLIEILACNTGRKSQWVEEGTFIDVRLTLSGDRDRFAQIHLPEVEARDYRLQPWTWASGRNCDSTVEFEGDGVRISTESLPMFIQRRLRSRPLAMRDGSAVVPTFEALSGESAIEVLHNLRDLMETYLESWNGRADSTAGAAANPDQVEIGRHAFATELSRFARGVTILEDPINSDLLTAFRLMNCAFQRRFSHLRDLRAAREQREPAELAGPPGWRTFQIVFIVSELSDLIVRTQTGREEPPPTVLWFPTGGGKTEAYLGLIVLHAFWDRLRGKPFGVTAVAKFPLRMLSLQQFSRVAGVMEQAEDLRVGAPELEGRRGDPFSVGYYAGMSNTLNLLDFPVSPDRSNRRSRWNREFDAILGNPSRLAREETRHNKVPACPVCLGPEGVPGRVETAFDRSSVGFRHQCRNCRRVLHLHLTDTEVFRRLPTLVIATIDKLARFAIEPWGRSLFGGAKARCAVHGYLIEMPVDPDGRPSTLCPILDCTETLSQCPPNVDPVPGLLVQDELHLLTESLGAFASHYETMLIDTARRRRAAGIGGGPWKIIGSTATIEGYRQLVRQLYNRGDAIRFPCPGPTATESFYSEETDEPQRFVLGVRSHGLSHVDTVMKILLIYHKIVAPVADPSGCALPMPLPLPLRGLLDPDRLSFARRYRTAVTYGISRNEVTQVNGSYVGQLNPFMERDGFPSFEPERVLNLTGDLWIGKVQGFLETIESGRDQGYIQAVTATSIISHGVDLDDLNLLVFRGMPHTISEYIQVMSRVGRRDGVPALVVNVYNPNRERDSSYFESHCQFLDLRSILLRNIPTTRFSRQALERTTPGMVLHYVNYESPYLDAWQSTTVAGLLAAIRSNPAEFVDAVRRSLGISTAPAGDGVLVRRQSEAVEDLIGNIRSELQRRPQGPRDERYASARLDVLNSLRDTDVEIPIFSQGSLGDRAGEDSGD